MSRVVIKLCGVTNERDAIEAALLGVDAIGFHFDPSSPRCVEPEVVRRIVDRLPVFVHKVGVFVDEVPIRVLEIARSSGLTLIQFDGRETPLACAAAAPFPWIKAFEADASFDPDDLSDYPTNTFVLRSSPGASERPSSTWEWRRARTLSLYGRILIGGALDATNVGLAVEDARPYGVDVCAGVEVAPGEKDLDRVELFVEAIRRAERRIREEKGTSA